MLMTLFMPMGDDSDESGGRNSDGYLDGPWLICIPVHRVNLILCRAVLSVLLYV